MTDITELAQREKFEAWFVNDVVGADVTFPAFEDGAYAEGEIYDEQLYFMLQAMWMAWKAAGAELVEALEKEQRYTEELREWNAGLAQESCERQQRISELLQGKVGSALLERENHHVEVVGKLTEIITELESEVEKWKQEAETWEHVAEKQLATAIELESRTVKLPPKVDSSNVPFAGDAWNACRAAMLAAAPHDTPALNSLQSVDRVTGGWIPVSERMPEMGEKQRYVLAADFKNNYWPNIPNTQVGVYGDWFDDGNPTWDDGDGEDLHLKEVTHWMPLPAGPQEPSLACISKRSQHLS